MIKCKPHVHVSSNCIWQSFVPEASAQKALLKESITKRSARVQADALSGGLSRWIPAPETAAPSSSVGCFAAVMDSRSTIPFSWG